MFKILLAESDPELKRTISRALVKGGYDVRTADSGEAALDLTEREYFDAVIAEIMLPRLDGFALVRSLRAAGLSIPVMLISENGGYEYLHRSFVSGADEYMSKPLNMGEMTLRIGALLRRTQLISDRTRTVGSTAIDYDAMTVSYDGKSIMLPLKEFLLLYKLCASPGRIVTVSRSWTISGAMTAAPTRIRSTSTSAGCVRICAITAISASAPCAA